MGVDAARVERGAAVGNDNGLPLAKRPKAQRIQHWCFFNSWAECARCGTLNMRSLTPKSMSQTLPAQIASKDCVQCQAVRKYNIQEPAERPAVLRDLSWEAQAALSPLEIDSGWYSKEPFGYRQRTTMMRFSWQARSVEHNISQLENQGLRRATRKAFRFLCEYTESAYSDYLAAHRAFLDKHGIDADDRVRKRWARYIESEAI
eukprot:12429875-Karenia_brevis.AAC.1